MNYLVIECYSEFIEDCQDDNKFIRVMFEAKL